MSRPSSKSGAYTHFLPARDDLARRQAVETNRRQHERHEAEHANVTTTNIYLESSPVFAEAELRAFETRRSSLASATATT